MHEEWTDRLSGYLDDELSVAERRAVEGHLAGCDSCRRVLADLQAVVAWAPGYEGTAPARDLWPAVAAGVDSSRTVAFPSRMGRRFTLAQMAAAAVLVAALSGGGVWLALGRSGAGNPAGLPVAADASLSVPATAAAMLDDPAYDAAVAELSQALEAGRGRLDSVTVRVIEENLRVIDAAIEESRAAIAADPSNVYLTTRIRSTMQRKLELLRHAAHAAGSAT